MEIFCCCVQGCDDPAIYRCEKGHFNLLLCNTHRRAHRVDCEYQRMHNTSRQERKSRIIYGLETSLNIPPKDIKLICSQQSVEFACLHSLPISIPTDYYECLKMMSNTFIDIIMKIQKDKIDLFIPYECKMFIKALKRIIYNIKVDEDSFIKQVLETYKRYHSELPSCLITGINTFLDKAERELLLPRRASKMLFFTLDLEEQKQKFILSYINKDYVDFQNFQRDFFHFFTEFIGDKYRDLSLIVDELEVQYKKDMKEQKKICEDSLTKITCKLWDEIAYQCLGIFVYIIPDDSEAISISNNWVMISCMVLVQEKIKFHSIVELSDRELLIALRPKMEKEPENSVDKKYDYYFIYYDGFESSLVNLLPMDFLIVASGSIPSSIIICYDKPYKFAIYAIENKTLVKKTDLLIDMDPQEVITGVVFVSHLNKILISTTNEYIISYVIGEFKVKIASPLHGESCINLKYYPEKKRVLYKTPNFLMVFNDYMQLSNSFDIEGNETVGVGISKTEDVETLETEIMVFIMFHQSLIGIKANSNNYDPYTHRFPTFVRVKNCLRQSFDFDRSNKEPQKYQYYIEKPFSVPDSRLDFEVDN